MAHDEWLIKENIVQLRQLMSDQNLQLLPDYEQRIQVLKELDFIDEGSRVELKGKVACEVRQTRQYPGVSSDPSIDSLGRRVGLNGAHSRKHPGRFRARRDSGPLVGFCFPGKDRRRANSNSHLGAR